MSTDAESVIQRQLDAYNLHDVEGLVASYADDAEVFLHPDQLVARGSDQIRARYAARFAANKPKAVLRHRTIVGNTVVDEEEITAVFDGETKTATAIAIFEVRDGKIARGWFVF